MVVWHDWKPWTSWTSWLRGHLAEFQNSANSASVQKAICRSLPDWDNFLVELVEFCNSTNTKHKCEHNIGRFLLKYFYKCPSVNRAIIGKILPLPRVSKINSSEKWFGGMSIRSLLQTASLFSISNNSTPSLTHFIADEAPKHTAGYMTQLVASLTKLPNRSWIQQWNLPK